MRRIDNDLKKQTDELNEARNHLASLSKGKEGGSYFSADLGELIYRNERLNPNHFFVEKFGTEVLSTVIAIVHKYRYSHIYPQ